MDSIDARTLGIAFSLFVLFPTIVVAFLRVFLSCDRKVKGGALGVVKVIGGFTLGVALLAGYVVWSDSVPLLHTALLALAIASTALLHSIILIAAQKAVQIIVPVKVESLCLEFYALLFLGTSAVWINLMENAAEQVLSAQ
jgi:hypothetical protein